MPLVTQPFHFIAMFQQLLPLFPTDTCLLTPYIGVREQEGLVHHLLNGLPIYSHSSTDHLRFRYITSHLLLQGLCKNQDIVDLFHVSHDSVRRWKKKLSEEGESAFLVFLKVVAVIHRNCFLKCWLVYNRSWIKAKAPIR